MGIQNHSKLNQLEARLPEGLPVDSGWLEQHGYSRALRGKYAAHGWLEQVAHGVYRRPPAQLATSESGTGLRWEQVVISLQTLLQSHYAVGGRTALELQGLAHYLSSSAPREVHLYGAQHAPTWVRRLSMGTRFVFHNSAKLFRKFASGENWPLPETTQGDRDHALTQAGLVLQRWGSWEWPLILSSPERAMLELLAEVPQRETFHQADVLMEGLVNLRPERTQALLVDCRSVKVKRLFLWFAERHRHAWLNKLDRQQIDLGRGKRVLATGGRLDTQFNITVPEDLHGNQ